ncbi:probable linoleate 9S-lipoxygenase 5 [Elaeis guineensis]|uniref:Lipoxygenase n=1 Tax=Elaeis guineensis var. tenera TaxID=51953 RepID=A0A6I9QR80_ELAGV|nr:probable linoleate 9S-lipoxygenase 5 [Elaeis guineensis]
MMQGLAKLRQKFGYISPPCTQQDEHATKATVVISRKSRWQKPGKKTTFRLYSSSHVDINTGRGKLSPGEVSLRKGKKTKHGSIDTLTYRVYFILEPDFGIPGAIVVKNGDRDEFFLRFVTLELSESSSIHFDCNSWIYPFKKTNTDRVFFFNTSFLPRQTPLALQDLRQDELISLRGNGRGERKEWERIYDYDRYNDLGEPDKGQDHVRPVLGGSKAYPYPRRGRTGRPLCSDRATETRNKIINLDFYVPPDERFSPIKLSEFISNSIQAVVHFVIPELKSLFQGDLLNFESLDRIKRDLYYDERNRVIEGIVMEKLKVFLPNDLFKEVNKAIKEHPIKFPVPQVIAADDNAWRTDEEFGREMLAGLNPAVIRCLETFPPVGRGERQSSITASHIEGKLDGLTIEQAIDDHRILILDHHDYLMPYLRRINAQGVCVYASRTLLFVKRDRTLRPLVIELSLPVDERGEEISRVFLPASQGPDGALWQLAKAQVAVNDSGHHQLISHWLYTHATVEPFIIATRRHLSTMHPIYKLIDPHFKDTMHINSLARSILLNAGGILEKTMFPGKYALELSSTIYESWRFTEQALPKDLVKRGLAEEDPDEPSGVRLLLKDYPYGADGLDVWTAIQEWVTNYCEHFYHDDQAIITDIEIQAWWKEICQIGHGDKRSDDECWLPLDSLTNLVQVLTTLIWIASALHAAINFGQYGYAGYPPNRPTRCRKFIPAEGTPEYADFLRDPDKYYLEMLPDRFTTTLGIALIEVLSGHTADEVYLGQRTSTTWTNDGEVLRMFQEFGQNLRRVENGIEERNKNPRLKNRWGPAKIPYTLLYPDISNMGGEKGVTGKGIPNSVSI